MGLLTRIAGITALALGLMGGSPMSVLADPDISADPNPYPDVNNATKFRQADFEQFLRDDTDGAWFSTPRGLNCAIWIDGSFGCNGSFPGAPAGTNQVAWFPGIGAPISTRPVNSCLPPRRVRPCSRRVTTSTTGP